MDDDRIRCWSLSERTDLIEKTANLLQATWPRKDPTERVRDILDTIRKDTDGKTSSSSSSFPSHYVLVFSPNTNNEEEEEDENKKVDHVIVVAHGKLVDSEDTGELGRVCIVYDVAVDPKERKKGYGRRMMKELERIAKEAKYHWTYLHTSPKLSRTFYRKCGYKPHEAVTAKKRVLRGIAKNGGLARLESLLRRMNQHERIDRTVCTKSKRSRTDEKVWLRKRLSERFYRRRHQSSTTSAESNNVVAATERRIGQLLRGRKNIVAAWYPIEHLMQIGPSCGLCALAMADMHLRRVVAANDPSRSDEQSNVPSLSSAAKRLLRSARRKEYTYDGEMLRIDDLYSLAKDIFPDVRIRTMNALRKKEIVGHILRGTFARSFDRSLFFDVLATR